MKIFPTKGQFKSYAMRRAKYEWKRETGYYNRSPNRADASKYNVKTYNEVGRDTSKLLGIMGLIVLVLALIFYTKITLFVLVGVVLLSIFTAYPAVFVGLLILAGVFLLAFITS